WRQSMSFNLDAAKPRETLRTTPLRWSDHSRIRGRSGSIGAIHLLCCVGSCILVLTLVLVTSLPGVAKAMEISELQGRWDLVSMNGQPVRAGEPIFFEIEGLAIRGFDGCNNFGGRIDAPSRLVTSQRACEPNVETLPLKLTDPLPQLKASRLVEERLLVPLPGGAGEAQFRSR